VRLGEWHLDIISEPFPHITVNVAQIRLHENFNRINLKNDIAILTLENAVEFDRHIRPLCLPSRGFDFSGRKYHKHNLFQTYYTILDCMLKSNAFHPICDAIFMF